MAFVATHRAALVLLALALATRLPLMSISLDEGDSANFFSVLAHGYNILELRPHAPGYPVYILLGSAIDAVLNDPLLSLTFLSAVMGSLAVVPFYLLLKEVADARLAFVGSLLFVVNPMGWSYGESALSDIPSASLVLLAAWLAYVGRRREREFLFACVVMSLAVGVRQANAPLVVLLAFPVGYRYLASGDRSWRVPALGAALFFATSLAGNANLVDYDVVVGVPAERRDLPAQGNDVVLVRAGFNDEKRLRLVHVDPTGDVFEAPATRQTYLRLRLLSIIGQW